MFKLTNPNYSINLSASSNQTYSYLRQELSPREIIDDHQVHYCGMVQIDTGGCAYYRSKFPSMILEQRFSEQVSIVEGRVVFSPEMLKIMDSIVLQRLNQKREIEWMQYVVLPFKEKTGLRIIYDTDDILVEEDIPQYNFFRSIFSDGKEVVPYYMEHSDLVTVTCQKLADYYSKKFSIDPKKFKVLPNCPPKFLFGHFSENDVLVKAQKRKGRKFRICFSCSPSHFDVRNRNGGMDDFSEIQKWILGNRHRYQFIFHGGSSAIYQQYEGDFEFVKYGNFLDYPEVRRNIQADLYIQPMQKTMFNECKSPIKLFESWAEGVPILVQDLENYKNTDVESCFSSADDLERKVAAIADATPEEYTAKTVRNYGKLEQYWLENHIEKWIPVLFHRHHS